MLTENANHELYKIEIQKTDGNIAIEKWILYNKISNDRIPYTIQQTYADLLATACSA